MERVRTPVAHALILLGVVLTLVGVPALYVREQVASERALTDRLTNALQSQHVRELAAERAADGLIESRAGDLLTIKPLLVPAIESFLASPLVESATRFAAGDAYRVLIEGDDESLVLDLGSASAQLASALRAISPQVAEAVPADFDAPVLTVDGDEPALVAVRRLAGLRSVGLYAPLAALAAFALGIGLSPRRRLALAWTGGGLALAGGVLAVTLAIARALTIRSATDRINRPDLDVQDAVGALWDAMLGDLDRWAVSLVVAGAVTVIVGGAAIKPSAIAVWLRDAAVTFAGRPRSRRIRALRAAGVVLLGAVLVAEPLITVSILLQGAGALAVFWGLAELTAAIEVQGEVAARAPGLSRGRFALLLAGAAMAIGAASVAAATVSSSSTETRQVLARPETGCMGSARYCDLRLSDVAIPATHNSFSAAAEPGWYFANQRYGIARQLQDGIRGFLLDFHLGIRASNGRIRTDLRGEEQSRNRVAKALDPQQLRLAERLAGRLGAGDMRGPRDVYLCHSVCELGAELAVPQLRLLADFLKRNPGEIIVIFAEPYVRPVQIERVFDAAGLLPYVARLRRDRPLPTLAELVKADERLVVFTEQDGGDPDWYLDGFSFVQDTPLGATRPSQLSCARNRGEADSPLLLVNNWIDTFPPRPSSNRAIGGAFLAERLRRCARRRDMAPGLVAVDFYDRSGVVRTARSRNDAAAQRLAAATARPPTASVLAPAR